MVRFAIVENGVVVNVAVGGEPLAENWIASNTAEIGYTYANGEFSAPEVPVTAPQSVTALQGMLAIDAAGLSAAYEAWASDPGRTFAERAFINKALNWRRNDPVLLAGAQVLGLTSENLDSLFIAAASL